MMTEKKVVMNKKQNDVYKGVTMFKTKEQRNQNKKMKQMRKKRLIIRNLSFKVSEEKLKEIFSEFGEVLEAKIPVAKDGRKRGFAFIQYKDTKSQFKAMKTLNFKKIDGRPIAIDFAVDKTTYQSQLQNQKPSSDSSMQNFEYDNAESGDSDNEDVKPNTEIEPQSETSSDDNDDEEDDSKNNEEKKLKSFLKEFDAGAEEDEDLNEDSDESSEEEENGDEVESEHSDDTASASDIARNKRQSQDLSEGKTIFIRNISFKNSVEDLQEIMGDYGKFEYCLLCVDPLTDHPKGTAFIKFKEKESADKLIKESSKEPGILLDGRRLVCSYAVSREELSKIYSKSTKVKDKRNLRLLKCGIVMQDSKESEGVSQSDKAKRAQLEMMKKQKLRNVNFFVSDKRLAIHNLPKNITDKDLRALFKRAAGEGTIIKEARVMRDFKKTDAQGVPVSRGFGFVSFTDHDHALKALTELNNNPNIFTSQKRPIVEFSVENKVALLSQERRREKIKMKHKKNMEERLANNDNPPEDNWPTQSSQKAVPRKKRPIVEFAVENKVALLPQERREKIKMKHKKNIEERLANNDNPPEDNRQTQSSQKAVPRKKINKRKNKDNNFPNKKLKQNSSYTQSPNKIEAKTSKKKQKKRYRNRNKKGTMMNNQDNDSLSQLKNQYKEKLLNKFS